MQWKWAIIARISTDSGCAVVQLQVPTGKHYNCAIYAGKKKFLRYRFLGFYNTKTSKAQTYLL